MHPLISDPNVWGALPAGYAVLRALEWASRKAALLARVGRALEAVGRIMQGGLSTKNTPVLIDPAIDALIGNATAQTVPPEFTSPAATSAPVATPAPDAPTEAHV